MNPKMRIDKSKIPVIIGGMKRKAKANIKLLVGRAGPHHEVSPMGHATRTKSRKGKQAQLDRKLKQHGWRDD